MKTLPPLALQLYSVREALAQDFEGVVRKIAAMGYAGVETAGFPGTTPAEAARLFRSLGLEVAGAHSALPLGDQKNAVLDMMAELGARYLICPALDRATYFTSVDTIRRGCDLLNEANAVAQQHGLILGYHNHWWEYELVEGQHPYQIMAERLEPGVIFEVDTYWVKTAGHDPAAVLRELGRRAVLLHLKDGPATQEAPMVALGEGVMDFPALIEAAGGTPEWLIVELDRCATDVMDAVEASFQYVIAEGLARGRAM